MTYDVPCSVFKTTNLQQIAWFFRVEGMDEHNFNVRGTGDNCIIKKRKEKKKTKQKITTLSTRQRVGKGRLKGRVQAHFNCLSCQPLNCLIGLSPATYRPHPVMINCIFPRYKHTTLAPSYWYKYPLHYTEWLWLQFSLPVEAKYNSSQLPDLSWQQFWGIF